MMSNNKLMLAVQQFTLAFSFEEIIAAGVIEDPLYSNKPFIKVLEYFESVADSPS